MRFTILTAAAENYALPLAVMVRSLLEHWNTARDFELVIVDGGISATSKARLLDSWRDAPGSKHATVRFAPVDEGLSGMPVWGRQHPITYARIGMAQYASAASERVLYLDVDMLLVADAGELLVEDLQGNVAGAAVDPFIPTIGALHGIEGHVALGLSADQPYFNAGLLLVDLGRWREAGIAARCFEHIARNASRLNNFDQDALNVTLAGQWKALDRGWQAHPRHENATGRPADRPAKLYHFYGAWKPWRYRLRHVADDLFEATLDRTAWRGTRPAASWRAAFYRAYDAPWRRLVFPLEDRLLYWWNRQQRRAALARRETL